MTATRARPSDLGQAIVEFVALLPVLAALSLCLGQCALAGYVAWSASGAARVGARAQALGDDARDAVRGELPRFLRVGAKVEAAGAGGDGDDAGRVTVRLLIPSVVPGLRFGSVRGRAQLPGQSGA